MKVRYKNLVLAGLLSVSAPAALALERSSNTATLAKLPSHMEVHQRSYGINPELGRAWIEVSYGFSMFDESPMHQKRIAVEGLSYDAERQAVIYRQANNEAVCATARERGFGPFKSTYMHPTGACDLSLERVTVTQDDGFHVREVPKLAIQMAVQEASSMQLANSGQ